MATFPDMVYRVPGLHRASGGYTYDYRGVSDADELSDALAAGWFRTIAEAIAGEVADEVIAEAETRAALEVRAKALGVSFNWKTSDAALAERIAAAS